MTGCFSSERIFPTRTVFESRQSHTGRKRKVLTCVRRTRSAGSSVIARTAATIIDRFFVYASGLKSRPSCASRARTGRNATAMTRRAKKLGPATCFTADTTTSW